MISEANAVPGASRAGASSAELFQEGIVAGMLGAATIALWFLILDTVNGRPLYTPSVLGAALFRGGSALEAPETLPISLEMVIAFTWVHFLAFGFIGGVAAHLIALAERTPAYGFGIVLLFVFFEFGFLALGMVFAESLIHALAWPAILLGNLLAAAAMVAYFWRRHPHLVIEP